jgi:alpha-L-glutamate ligase-like protein
MLRRWLALKRAGVLGLNARNARYTLEFNPRRLLPLVDDKLITKRLATAAGIAVPECYVVIEEEHEIHGVHERVGAHADFVVKPAQGSGGDGILVITGHSRGGYRKISGDVISRSALEHHLSNILSGMYSLGGQADKAIIEYRVRFDPVFEAISHQGVPDVRIIVFLGVPVMAMVRLPTRQSDGKANLHQGAIGAGIDVASGRTLRAVWQNEVIEEHPDTGNPVTAVTIPGWDRLLDIAARCYELTGLGYQGVDMVLDRDLGPLMLELNARPGLNIQIANQAGLLPRLDAVEEAVDGLPDIAARVAFARQRFAAVS